jgi:hypothetical protein
MRACRLGCRSTIPAIPASPPSWPARSGAGPPGSVGRTRRVHRRGRHRGGAGHPRLLRVAGDAGRRHPHRSAAAGCRCRCARLRRRSPRAATHHRPRSPPRPARLLRPPPAPAGHRGARRRPPGRGAGTGEQSHQPRCDPAVGRRPGHGRGAARSHLQRPALSPDLAGGDGRGICVPLGLDPAAARRAGRHPGARLQTRGPHPRCRHRSPRRAGVRRSRPRGRRPGGAAVRGRGAGAVGRNPGRRRCPGRHPHAGWGRFAQRGVAAGIAFWVLGRTHLDRWVRNGASVRFPRST